MEPKWLSAGLIVPKAWKNGIHARIDALYPVKGHKGLLACAMLTEILSRSDDEIKLMVARICFVEQLDRQRFLKGWEEAAKLLADSAAAMPAMPARRKRTPGETA